MKTLFAVTVMLAAVLMFSCWNPCAAVEIGGPAIATDDPSYPGIGKLRDINAVIKAAYEYSGNPKDNTGKALALWRWMLEHMYHCSSRPIECLNNLETTNEDAGGTYDMMKFLSSYQFAICYASASAMCGLMEAAGYPSRGRGVSGHTVMESFWDNDWHYIDHDMCGVTFEKDHKTLASVEEIIADRSLIDWDYRKTYNLPLFPWDGGPGSGTMKGAFSLDPARSWKYNDFGTAVHPTNLVLRRGETFTRYYNYDRAPWGKQYHWTGLTQNTRYFPNGPSRDKTYVMDPAADGSNDGRPRQPYVADGAAHYGNGLFEYSPDLASGVYREGAAEVTGVEDGGSPKIKGGNGGGSVVFRQWSPYAICGVPEGGNPFGGKVTDAVVISGKAVGDGVKVEVSNSNGIRWDSRTVKGDFSEDFSMICRARYRYSVRLVLPQGAGLDDLCIRTAVMCSPALMPHLHDGTTRVTYSAPALGVVCNEPDFSAVDGWDGSWHEINNISFDDSDNAKIKRGRIQSVNSPAFGVLKLEAPGKIKRIAVMSLISTRTPPRENCLVSLQFSKDGKNWKGALTKTLATDADHWRHWLSADQEVDYDKEAYVRLYIEAHGTQTALCRMVAYAYYESGPGPALEIEHVWQSSGSNQNKKVSIPAGAGEQEYTVSCGSKVTNISVAFRVANNAAMPDGSGKASGGAGDKDDDQGGRPKPPPVETSPEKKAEALFHVAVNLYLKNGMIAQGRQKLEQLLAEYPETEAAGKARTELKKLDEPPAE
ncbi:MAG: hypothetical protein JW909_00005 [Planctomycetes bacterium]|nr:hypothetical protein [Planctomycetota bacterium]